MQYPCGWVSPFGHYRIKAYCQLPDTFRRLSRPSSPLTAKASTVCAYSLDHITPSCLRMTRIPANGTTYHYFNKAARAARLSLFRHVGDSRLKRSLLPLLSKNMPRPQCQVISKCVCADHDSRWWSLTGSNRRPPACKAGALPAELRPHGTFSVARRGAAGHLTVSSSPRTFVAG